MNLVCGVSAALVHSGRADDAWTVYEQHSAKHLNSYGLAAVLAHLCRPDQPTGVLIRFTNAVCLHRALQAPPTP